MPHGICSKETHRKNTEHTHCGRGAGGGQRFKVILTTHKFEASLNYETLEGKGEWGRGVRAFFPHIFLWFWVYMCARLFVYIRTGECGGRR